MLPKFSSYQQIIIGITLISFSLTLSGFIFYPFVLTELKYQLNAVDKNNLPTDNPPTGLINNQDLQITIPKINVNSSVLINIDPYNKSEYKEALEKGPAHAKNSSLPGESGNVFIFAHNHSTFTMLNKLQPGDEINLNYQGKNFKYKVKKKEIINPDQVEFLEPSNDGQTLTLMTCWPPGTNIKRLIILSNLS